MDLVDADSGCPMRRPGRRSSACCGSFARIFVTHFHPDHIGAARRPARAHRRARLPGRPRLRAMRARLGPTPWSGVSRLVPPARDARRRHGDESARGRSTARSSATSRTSSSRPRRAPHDGLGDRRGPGHADEQLCLLKDGVLVAADHLLTGNLAYRRSSGPRAGPTRSATTSPRSTGDRAARESHLPGMATWSGIQPAGPRARAPPVRLEETAPHSKQIRSGDELSPLFGERPKALARRFTVPSLHAERLAE